ncbi:hypothetical protein AA101099_0027 [Neoasaia chiangmaiensis NBRC 101099]|nr:hypothetical protein AA101099_0027 [Neoasaia chiangmaiensis NBRC 101099]GEN16346.1 hypothetical protein NCH01_27770 [Neoasaia chiangmaiensis]
MFFLIDDRRTVPMSPSGKTGGSSHNPGSFGADREKASSAGQKGGQHSAGAKKEHSGSGNFADNPEKASEAGHKGGKASHKS